MAGNEMALKSNPFGWPEPPAALSYGAAVLSVAAAAGLVSLMDSYLQVIPHVALFLLAIMFCTWFGGSRPGLLAVALSTLAFDYFFVAPVYSLAVEAVQLPRFVIFVVTAFFGWSVSGAARRATESLSHARDELQRNNEALREREELTRVLTENANDLIRLHTTEGRSVYASPSVERLFGRLPSSIFEFAHPEDQEACRHWWEQVAAGGAGRLQWRVRDGDGNWRWLESSASRLQFKGRPYVLTVCRDITERKRAEEVLRETHSKLELLLNTSPLPITSVDASGRITSWNKAAERLFGWSAEEAVERVCPTIRPEETGEYLELIRRVMRGETYVGLVLYRQKRDGGLLYCSVSAAPQRNGRGEPVGATLIVEDITERVRAEEQLKRTNEELRALSARLHSVREEESTRIAREIHDELGALLSSLKWDLEEIGEDVAGATGTPPLAAVREKVGALITLTDNAVNTVRRIASELRPTALEEFGLAEALRWHAEQFQARTGIEVRCDCPQDGAGLNREQATAVFRIVQEALTNILRHAEATRVDIRMNKEAGHVVLTISDNGRGITEAEKSASQSLGLLGMRERVHLLGGEMNIEGTNSRGTVVTVRVPVIG